MSSAYNPCAAIARGFLLGRSPQFGFTRLLVLGLRLAKGRETGPWVDCEAMFFCHDHSKGIKRTSIWAKRALSLIDEAGLSKANSLEGCVRREM